MLIEQIRNRESGIVLYGVVPPKQGTAEDKVRESATKQVERLKPLKIDGLVLYDIQDETSRTEEERPFPFMATLDSFEYSRDHLRELSVPKIIYRAVGKYSKDELTAFLTQASTTDNATIFVGASSRDQEVTMSIRDAYKLKSQVSKDLLIGGVTIPERHLSKGDEHLRVFNKIAHGCSFFYFPGSIRRQCLENFSFRLLPLRQGQ